jgi:hypothetical protein
MRVIPPIDIVPATFTRASTGTYLRHDGALVTAAVDEPRWNYGYAPEPADGPLVNLVPYSEDFAAWTQSNAAVVPGAIASPYAGKLAAKIVENTAVTNTHFINLGGGTVVAGRQVTYWADLAAGERTSVMFRILAGGAFTVTRFFYVDLLTGAVSSPSGTHTSAVVALSGGFWRVALTATADTTGTVTAAVLLANPSNVYTGDGVSGAYIARAQVNLGPVPQDYIETNDEAGYTPPAWVFKGLSQEEEATNLCLRSQELGTAPWTAGRTLVLADAAVAPDGTVTADKIVGDSTQPGGKRQYQAMALVVGVTYTYSIYLKKAEYRRARLLIGVSETPFTDGTCFVDLETGLVVSGVGYTEYCGDGWWRCWLVVTATATNPTIYVSPADNANSIGFVGDNVSGVYVWGAQVELGTAPTSYIPTTAAAVTRAADAMGVGMISSIGEPEPGQENAWAAGTNWATGAVVVRTTTHKRYERLAPGGVDASLPETSPTEWLELGPSNQQAMWDLTNNQATASTDPIHVAVKPGQRINSIYLGNLAATDVAVTSAVDGELLYTNVQNLRQPRGVGWYSYLFSPFAYRKNVALLDLPALSQAVVSASLIRTTSGQVQCGFAVLGQSAFIGLAQYSAKRSRRGFSTVERDVFGNATLTKRKAIPVVDATLWIKKELVNSVLELADELDAEPAAWLGLDDATDGYFDAISFVGVYQTLDVDVDYPNDAKVIFKAEGI